MPPQVELEGTAKHWRPNLRRATALPRDWRLVQQALHNLMRGRTTLVIAHRLSTVRSAHKIVVLDKGEIVEVGRHEDLLSHRGVYRKLYDLQFLADERPTGAIA